MFKSNLREYEGKNFYSYSARNSNGEEISMSTYLGKVCMVVNIASQYEHVDPSALSFPTTGLAEQNFKELCELDKRYRDHGLVILGFPTNQFGGMEPNVQEEILSLIRRKYNVDFEIYQKIDVNGPNTHPLFDYLKNVLPGTLTNDLKWHFTKFLIDRNGNPVKRYAPNDAPFSFEEEIRYLLKQESALVKGLQSRPGFEDLPGQAGLQGNIGQQSTSLPSQGFVSEMDWEKGLDKKKEKGKDWERSSGMQGPSQNWYNSKDWSKMGTIEMLREQQRMREWELQQDHERAARDLGQSRPLGIGQAMNLQEQADFENLRQREREQKGTIQQLRDEQSAKEWDLKKDHAMASVQSGAYNLKEKAGETVQYVKDKAGDAAQYLKESAQNLSDKGTIQELRDEQSAKEWDLKKDHAKANIETGAQYVKEKVGEGVQYVKESAQALKEKVQDVTGLGQQQQQVPETQYTQQYVHQQPVQTTSTFQQQQVLQKPPQHVQQYQQPIGQQFQQQQQPISKRESSGGMSKKETTTSNLSQQPPVYKETTTTTTTTPQQPAFKEYSSSSSIPKESSSGLSQKQQEMGFKKQEDLTGEGGTVGAQMGIHLGAHSVQAGIQAGKDPQKTQEQKK
jgi:glutathione peroxidase